jgi:hypothetical protein
MVIETISQLDDFMALWGSHEWIVVPILSDTKVHPLQNKLCALYIKPIESDTDAILAFDHTESLNLPYDALAKLETGQKKYVYDKKEMNHIYKFDNVIDVNMLHYQMNNKPLLIDNITTPAHQFFHVRHYRKSNLNSVIPIMKHLEYCRNLAGELGIWTFIPPNDLYNNQYMDNMEYIESAGLRTLDGMAYTNYNMYTSTGRPSNAYGGTNYAALNKSDETRKKYISRFGKDGYLIEYDFSGNHLYIIADLIGFKFTESPHDYLGKIYFDTDKLTPEQYKEGKGITFQLLYGGIDREFEKIDFFAQVNMYIQKLWNKYKMHSVVSPISGKTIYKSNLKNMNPQKLFNYMLQLLEFEDVHEYLNQIKIILDRSETKLILYTYDSLLFDFNGTDGKELLIEIKRIMESQGKLVTVDMGVNYYDMKSIDNYFV